MLIMLEDKQQDRMIRNLSLRLLSSMARSSTRVTAFHIIKTGMTFPHPMFPLKVSYPNYNIKVR